MKIEQLFVALVLSLPMAAYSSVQHTGGHGHGHEHEDTHESAAGVPGKAEDVDRTVDVVMNDTMRFTPDHLEVKAGETIRFRVRNAGKMRHEMVLGTASELHEHREMMRAMPDMKHEDANMISVAPGAEKEIIWKFVSPGEVEFACLVPGHYESGMKGMVKVKGE